MGTGTEQHLNRIPDRVHRIHLIAICGTAMGALACLLKDMGYDVTGSDQKIYPPMSTYLDQKGVPIADGFQAENLDPVPDLVVVGNAVTQDNPEAVRMRELGLNYCSMPQALNHFAARGKKTLLVTGTHGKTTTSAILTWVLMRAGMEPSFMIGGILKNFNSNYRLGKGKYLVVEGDEYDTAYFDKGPKFRHYAADIAILTSVEFDHADIFRDLDHVKRIFGLFVDQLSPSSMLMACDADRNINGLLSAVACRVERYGRLSESTWRLGKVDIRSPWTIFDIFKKDRLYGHFRTRQVGEHNLMNTLAVVGAADRLSISQPVIAEALETFQGVRRRQEVRGVQRGVTVVDDFAHHPTAVRETIRAIRPFYPEGRLIAVFEPRTNTSMRGVFQAVYPPSFEQADMICVPQPPLLWKVPEKDRFSSERLVRDLRAAGKDAYFFPDTDAIVTFLSEKAQSGDVILVMSNGGFDNIHEKLLASL